MVDHTRGNPNELVRGPAADLWRHTLAQIPTTFGRLAYLASLRNHNTGAYEHHGLSQVFGPEEAGRTLRESHFEIFSEWLRFGLERQKGDVAEYMAGLDEPIRVVLENWFRFSPYLAYLPAGAREAERSLFLSDLETVLDLLRREYGVACPDPES